MPEIVCPGCGEIISSIICRTCHEEFRLHNNSFKCPRCGEPIEIIICPNCGRMIRVRDEELPPYEDWTEGFLLGLFAHELFKDMFP
ncbi:MAG: hypothetical protein DRN04_14605 [Thermoprotei archaeon]|nr:MAG: hypothetical protein DRN04_14605 [Thermoprotei archaeon]